MTGGTIYYMTVTNLFSEYLKDKINSENNNKFEVIVVSKDIIADQQYSTHNATHYQSRYENINFAPELRPNPSVEEYLWGATIDAYADKYKYQLSQRDQMTTICSIIDMVINDSIDVVLVCSDHEIKMDYFEIMKDFIADNFCVVMVDYMESKKHPDEVDRGDYEKALGLLAFHIQNEQLVDEAVGVFFNKFTEDMLAEYKRILMGKTIDELFVIGTNRGIYVNRHKPKEYIVEHILTKIMDVHEGK